MKRVITIVLVVVLIASFFGTGFFLFKKSQEKPVVFKTDSVFVTNIVKKTVATGSIVPRKEIAIKSQVSGVVERLYVEPGQLVKKGQVIALIRIIPNVVNLNNAEANLRIATVNFENAQKELDRQKKLFEQKVISEFDYNQFLLTYKLRKEEK